MVARVRVALALIPAAVVAALPALDAANVGPLLTARFADAGGHGAIAVALVDGDRTQFLAVGSTGDAAHPKVDEHTLFEIGSITKTFTAAVLADAVLRKEVQLDTQLGALLDGPLSNDVRTITLEQLATHTSGLPRIPDDFRMFASAMRSPRDPYHHYRADDLQRYLSTVHVQSHKHDYSNLGFGLLGHALEHATHTTYSALIHDRVAAPLGMTETFVDVPKDALPRLALGHDRNGDPTPRWDLSLFAGAGAIVSSTSDLARYAVAVRDRTLPALDLAETPRADAGDAHHPNRRVGLAWIVDQEDGQPLVWHNGGTGGYFSFIGVRGRRAVVVLSSTGDAVTDFGIHLLAPNRPVQPPEPRLPTWAGLLAVAALFGAQVALDRRRKKPVGRVERIMTLAAEVLTLIALWHVLPWWRVGGPVVRAALLVKAFVAGGLIIASHRDEPWVTSSRARMIGRVMGLVFVLALAVWWS